VGQAGTGTGPLQGTRSKPVPMQQVQRVFFFVYLHVASVIFTGFGTQMSAANPLFTYLLCLGTNILILFGGK
jgi:hypothetical protein